MITWTGRLRKRVNDWSYDVYFKIEGDLNIPGHLLGNGPLCHTDSMLRRLVDYRDDINTWGYSANSTNQMALALLGWSLCGLQSETFYYRLVNCTDNKPDIQLLRELLIKYHKAFASEVVSELPNDWTMTSNEILEWLNKKEKEEFQLQHAATKKPKEKHGRVNGNPAGRALAQANQR